MSDLSHSLTTVVVDMQEPPRSGRIQIVIRLASEDRAVIQRAARLSNISMAQFTRTVLTQVAQHMIAEHALRNVERSPEGMTHQLRVDPTLPPGMKK